MRAVNLLPGNEARTGPGLPSPWVLLAATVPFVAGGLVYLGYSMEHSKVVDKRAEFAAVQARLDRVTAMHAGAAAQSGLLTLHGQREVALQDALSKSMAWDVTLEDLARVLPKGVSLTSLTAQSPTLAASAAPTAGAVPAAAAAAAAPQVFNLAGIAGTHDQVAETLERLSLLPMLTNVTLISTSTVAGTTAPAPNGSIPAATGSTPAARPVPAHVQFSLSAAVQHFPKPVQQSPTQQVPTAAGQ